MDFVQKRKSTNQLTCMLYQTHVCSLQTCKGQTERHKAQTYSIQHCSQVKSILKSRECHRDISFFRQLQKVEWRNIQARVGIAGVHPSPATKECSHHFMQTPSIYRTNYEHKSSRRCWNLLKRGSQGTETRAG